MDQYVYPKKLSAFLIDENGEHQRHLIIILKSITWNRDPAMSILVQDVTEKDMVVALKMAD